MRGTETNSIESGGIKGYPSEQPIQSYFRVKEGTLRTRYKYLLDKQEKWEKAR